MSFGDPNRMGMKWRGGSITDRRPNVIPPRGLPRICGLDSEPLDIFYKVVSFNFIPLSFPESTISKNLSKFPQNAVNNFVHEHPGR
jgi:hypothetical protein